MINAYNKNLAPLGIRVKKTNNPDTFIITHKSGSYIEVHTKPHLRVANLWKGETRPNNRQKGIGLALRTFATALLEMQDL